jgi:hypothetical protein
VHLEPGLFPRVREPCRASFFVHNSIWPKLTYAALESAYRPYVNVTLLNIFHGSLVSQMTDGTLVHVSWGRIATYGVAHDVVEAGKMWGKHWGQD